MHKNKKVTGLAFNVPAGASVGVLAGLLITLVGCAFIAYLLNAGKIGEGSVGFASVILNGLSTIVGALTATVLVKQYRIQVCITTGISYYLLLLALTAMFFGGSYQGMIITGVVVFISSITVALLPRGQKKTKKFSR